MIILETKGLSVDFRGLRALNKIDLQINEDEILGIIGPNGAGKTTFFNIIIGFLQPSQGSIIYKEVEYTGAKPHEIARKGIIRTFQITSLFSNLTAEENVIIGRFLKTKGDVLGTFFRTRTYRKKQADLTDQAREFLNFVGMDGKAEVIAKNLPFGDQRKLEIAIALAAEPKLLLLDEPATGLNVDECAELIKFIRIINSRGVTVLIVEHNMKVVMEICQRIAVFNLGIKIAEGTPETIASNQDVISVYLGKKNEHL